MLVERAGELVDRETLLDRVWPRLVVGENSVSQVVAALRRILGDDAQESRYIQTVPRKGFRFVAPVTVLPRNPGTSMPVEGRPVPSSEVRASGSETVPPAIAPAAITDVPTGSVSTDGPPPSHARKPAPASPYDPATTTARSGARAFTRRRVLAGLVATGAITASAGGLWVWRRQAVEGADLPAKVAVLPFTWVAGPDRESLLDVGMADSLIARISVLPGIAVLSPASVNRFGGSDRDPVAAARALDARWVVDGSVQRVGDRLRVVAHVLRADDGATVWSEVLDRDASALFDLQDELARGVARVLLGARSGIGRDDVPETGGTRSVEAYRLYLAAAWRAQGGRAADIERGIALVRQALAIDPDYAQAWALLAWIHRRRLWSADAPPAEVFAQSDAAVRHAIDLAPDLALARAGVAFSRFWFAYDWSGGEREFRRALAANPSEANAQWGLAFLLLTQGRIDEGFLHLRYARELDPLSPTWHTLEASFLAGAGRYGEALRSVKAALDVAPQLWLAHVALGRILVGQGDVAGGLAALRRAVELGPDTVRPMAHLATQLALHGDPAEARTLLTDIRRREQRGYVPPTSLAMVHAALGERDAALDQLDRAYELRDTRLVELLGDPSWKPLRSEPRFAGLLRRLNLDPSVAGLASV